MKQIPYLDPNHPKSQVIHATRLDLYQTDQGVRVNKYADGWTASTPPFETHVNPEWTLDAAIAWLCENGWTIRTWHKGARAWLGKLAPVRDHAGILKKRRLLERYPDPNIQAHAVDLAFDL